MASYSREIRKPKWHTGRCFRGVNVNVVGANHIQAVMMLNKILGKSNEYKDTADEVPL
jgi:hypothetical protein